MSPKKLYALVALYGGGRQSVQKHVLSRSDLAYLPGLKGHSFLFIYSHLYTWLRAWVNIKVGFGNWPKYFLLFLRLFNVKQGIWEHRELDVKRKCRLKKYNIFNILQHFKLSLKKQHKAPGVLSEELWLFNVYSTKPFREKFNFHPIKQAAIRGLTLNVAIISPIMAAAVDFLKWILKKNFLNKIWSLP